MCGDTGSGPAPPQRQPPDSDFPWDAGAIDAHCHPTDTMSSVAEIPAMRSRVLAIMATRSQDQDLVSAVASEHGLARRSDISDASSATKVVPSFGWHPWFSHQLLDDTSSSAAAASLPPPPSASGEEIEEFKARHYASVLNPAPEDPAFVAQLPTPTSLTSFLEATRSRLADHPVAMVGEVGLDKGFRLPVAWGPEGGDDRSLTPGGREGRKLSPHAVVMSHQVAVLKAQLALAGELQLPVSVHGVQAHGVLYDAISSLWKGHERSVQSRRERSRVAPHAEDWSSSSSSTPSSDEEDDDEALVEGAKPRTTASREAPRAEEKKKKAAVEGKPFPPRICLHSFSGSAEVLRRYIRPQVPAAVYVSLSTAVNCGTPAAAGRLADLVREIPDDRILVESDLHTAGGDMDCALEDMYGRVCEAKGWGLREGVERIRENFEAFVFG